MHAEAAPGGGTAAAPAGSPEAPRAKTPTGYGGTIVLVCTDGKRLPAHACCLALASPVLAPALELQRPGGAIGCTGGSGSGADSGGGGERELQVEEGSDVWEVALKMVHPTDYLVSPVTWDIVESLLRLADKYDMAVVRGYCANFLASNTAAFNISLALSSARNPLTAASLLERYCSTQESLLPFVTTVRRAAVAVLQTSCTNGNLEHIANIVLHDDFMRTLTPSVQRLVMAATTQALYTKLYGSYLGNLAAVLSR